MAMADIGVFMSQAIFTLAAYPVMYNNNTFRCVFTVTRDVVRPISCRAFFFSYRTLVNFIANFFSSCACWFVLAVSFER